MLPDARAEVAVNARQPELVVQWQQNMSHRHIAEKEAEYGLHVGHVEPPNHARYGDKGNAGNGSSDHAE